MAQKKVKNYSPFVKAGNTGTKSSMPASTGANKKSTGLATYMNVASFRGKQKKSKTSFW